MARSVDLNELDVSDLLKLIEMALDRLSVQDLILVRDSAETKRREKLDETKHALIEEMRGKLEEIGLTLDDLIPPRATNRGERRTRRTTGQAVPAKYRGPNNETWTGRGRVPQWLHTLEEAGRGREEFLDKPAESRGAPEGD